MKYSLNSLGYTMKKDRNTTFIFKSSRPELPAIIENKDTIGIPSKLKGRTQIRFLDPDMVARTLTHGGIFGHITGQRFLSPARSIRELEISTFLISKGIPTPEILALRIIHSGIFHYISVISKLVPDSVDLLTYLQDSPRDTLPLFRQTGDLIRKIHASGVYHADLHIKNILLDNHLVPWVLDLDKAYRFSKLGFFLERKTMRRFIHSCRKWQNKSRIMLPQGWETALKKGYGE